MKLVIAGGCGEHGRNCFWVKKGRQAWIVDCGLAEEGTERFPGLSKKMIQQAKYLFLTHSHKDHTGAVPWLMEMGFTGDIVASGNTFRQIPFAVTQKLILEEICPNGKGRLGGIHIKWGRSGHCPGSVWYQFRVGGKTILFSGDYTEHTTVYKTDFIRDKKADIALLDCAYGRKGKNYEAACQSLLSELMELQQKYPLLFFPVPRYGRGLELLSLLQNRFLDVSFYGDSHFIRQLESYEKDVEWYQSDKVTFREVQLYFDRVEKGFIFLSDPQLSTPEAKELTRRILKKGGYGVLTGTVEKDSFSEELFHKDKASLLFYPVHLNASQYQMLIQKNRFKKAIPFHSPEFSCDKEYKI